KNRWRNFTMNFGPRPLDQAEGQILAHNIADEDGRRLLRKGHILSNEDLDRIRQLGWNEVYVAELAPGDLNEDEASWRLAQLLSGANLELQGPTTGRTNLLAKEHGLLRVKTNLLAAANRVAGVTIATLPPNRVVPAHQLVASVKIIPYGLPADSLEPLHPAAKQNNAAVMLDPLKPKSVHLILHGSSRVEDFLQRTFLPPIQQRVESLESELTTTQFVPFNQKDELDSLSRQLTSSCEEGADLIIVAGETAIMDSDDLIPNAVRLAGGEVECVGAPVDPGNLLMLAYLGSTPVLGAPGCARSPKENVIDWVLPRLLVGERLNREDLIAMGPGGLLAEIKDRPMPRQASQRA
ncbi:MAG: molybdopterin-binding protein, partial [Anaerolineales bacterium]